jgi:hypothetical protein
MHNLTATDPATEDREYATVDVALSAAERCGALNAELGRVCTRRARHASERHRDGELSWTQDMAEQTSTATLAARLARFESILDRQPNHTHAAIMVTALTNELAARAGVA